MKQKHRPNRQLRLQRRLRGWSQEDVAAGLCRVASSMGAQELGVDATMISRWERGTRHPRPRYVRLLCQLFDLPAEQLGLVQDAEIALVPFPPGSWVEDDEGDRRDFLQHVASLLGIAPLPPFLRSGPAGRGAARPEAWERLERALSHPGPVDAATIEQLEQVTYALECLEPTAVGSRALLGPATGHLESVCMLLQHSLPSGLRPRLCALAGETAALVGWLRWNLDDPEGAAKYFSTGMRAAREAEDQALGAYLIGAIACRLPRQADPRRTLDLLTGRPYGCSQADASHATRAWLAAKEADAWAELGQEQACMRALERAEGLVEQVARSGGLDPQGRPRFTGIDRGWLAGERGASLVKLGHVEDARVVLQPVVASLGPTSERDRLWLLAALASAHVELDDPDEACRLARMTAAGAARMQLAPVLDLVNGLRVRLERHHRSLAVQELDDELRTLAHQSQRKLAVK